MCAALSSNLGFSSRNQKNLASSCLIFETLLNKLDGIFSLKEEQKTVLKSFCFEERHFSATKCCVTRLAAMIGCRPIPLCPRNLLWAQVFCLLYSKHWNPCYLFLLKVIQHLASYSILHLQYKTLAKSTVAKSALPRHQAYLVGPPFEIAVTLVQANTPSAVKVVACITCTALCTLFGTDDDAGEVRAWSVTRLATDLIVAVFRAGEGCMQRIEIHIQFKKSSPWSSH